MEAEAFIPVRFLTYNELQLLRRTEERMKDARSLEEIKYYELVLDVLTISAINRKKENKDKINQKSTD